MVEGAAVAFAPAAVERAATSLRKEFGLDMARIVLRHTSPALTELYAEADRAKAVVAMELVG